MKKPASLGTVKRVGALWAKDIMLFCRMIWEFIKADRFFPKYCPEIKSYKHKIRGKNGRGNPTGFSAAEDKAIKAGLKKMYSDLKEAVISNPDY